MFSKLFFVFAHLLFNFLNNSIQRNDHIGTVIGCKKIVCFLSRHADFDHWILAVFQIDDDANRGRSFKESRQALDLVADGLLNGVTQVTVLRRDRYFHPGTAPTKKPNRRRVWIAASIILNHYSNGIVFFRQIRVAKSCLGWKRENPPLFQLRAVFSARRLASIHASAAATRQISPFAKRSHGSADASTAPVLAL